MCQPQSEGGRRCPIHQPATLGLKKALTAEYGLMTEQIDHTFRSLHNQGTNRPNPTMAEYEHFINRQKEMLDRSNLTDSEKRSAIRQFDKPLEEHQLPDGATFYALKNFRPRTRERKREFVQMIREIAQHKGINRNQALEAFKEEYSSQAGGNARTNNLSDDFDSKTISVHQSLLGRETTTSDGQPEFSTEPRITREDWTGRSTWIRSLGYDSDDGRLEIEMDSGVYAYRNVSQAQADRIQSTPDAPSYIATNILRNRNHQYASSEEAQRDAYGRYCQDCHKYRAISGHVCDFSASEARTEEELASDIQEAISNTDETDTESSLSYDSSLQRIKESFGQAATPVEEPAEEETPVAPRRRRQSTGPTARERRWLRPLEDRETKVLDETNTEVGEYRERQSYYGFTAPAPRAIRRAVVTEGDVAEFSIKEQVSTYDDAGGYSRQTITQDVKAYVDNTDGNIKFERTGTPKCGCEVYQRNGRCSHLFPSGGSSRRGYLGTPADEAGWDAWAQKRVDLAHSKIDNGSFIRQGSLNDAGGFTVNLRTSNTGSRRRRMMYAQNSNMTLGSGFNATELREMRNVLNNGQGVTVAVPEYSNGISARDEDYHYHMLSGEVTLIQEDGQTVVQENSLRCRYCGREECGHGERAGNFVRDLVTGEESGRRAVRQSFNGRVNSGAVIQSNIDYANVSMEERLRLLDESTSSSWLANQEDVEAINAAFQNSITGVDNSYSSNLDKYVEDVRAAEAKMGSGENALPYSRDEVTNGICSPESGRAFGVELEFDVKGSVNRREALQAIGRDLKEAGLTTTSDQQYYHANRGAANPYTTWTFEQDCTVDGEIVSPKLYDTPETWEQIEKVCEIVKRHGGSATAKTGGHVHMGLGAGSNSEVARRKAAVTQLYSAYQDSLRRVQTSPSRKKHRASQWTMPLDESTAQNNIYSIREGRRLYENHHTSLNLGHEGRVEFRGADGSLDPAHIQAQVVVAAGLVSAAERGEYAGDRVRLSKIGENAKKTKLMTKGQSRKLNDDELIVSDVEMRSFADTVLNWEHGRKVAAGTSANTPWQEK